MKFLTPGLLPGTQFYLTQCWEARPSSWLHWWDRVLMSQQKQIEKRPSTTLDIVLLGEHAKMLSSFCASTSGFFFTPIAVDPEISVPSFWRLALFIIS
jgi:hypothetical protein